MRTSAACSAYTAFLTQCATAGPYPVLVAALVPCFWAYRNVGERILARTAHQPHHPYRAWIDTYADASFAAAVDQVRGIADCCALTASDQIPAMLSAFSTSTGHERAFWDAAWSAKIGCGSAGGIDQSTPRDDPAGVARGVNARVLLRQVEGEVLGPVSVRAHCS